MTTPTYQQTSGNNGNNGLALYAPPAPPAAPELEFSERQVDIIRRQIAPDLRDGELQLFLEVCRTTGLNPIFRQIYAIVRGKDGEEKYRSMTIQTGIDGYRLLAARTGSLAGIDDAEFDLDTDEAWHPRAARVTVWRFVQGVRVPFTATARWSEYAQRNSEGKYTGMWSKAKMPFAQLAKCAEALALRKACPAELSGIYTGDEMAQADNPSPLPYVEATHTTTTTTTALAHEADPEPDRIGAALKQKPIFNLLVQLQRFNDKDRRAELASVFAAIEARGEKVTSKTVPAELKARIADLDALSAPEASEAAPDLAALDPGPMPS